MEINWRTKSRKLIWLMPMKINQKYKQTVHNIKCLLSTTMKSMWIWQDTKLGRTCPSWLKTKIVSQWLFSELKFLMKDEQIKIYSNFSLYNFQAVDQKICACLLVDTRMNFSNILAPFVKILMKMINGALRTIHTGFWWVILYFSNLHLK